MERKTVKLLRLIEGKAINPRADAKKISVADLVASIPVHGVLQPLIVSPAAKDGYFDVGDGNRRLKALKSIHGKGAGGVDVDVIVIDPASEDINEVALAANTLRVSLHPVDEYRAFQKLIDGGLTPLDIAKRFGVTEKHVRQRMQLMSLHPDLLDEWRDGKMVADQAKALSASPDQERQLEVWNAAIKRKDGWGLRPESLRAAVVQGVQTQDSPEFKLVGAAAYEEAGGAYSDDLFAEDRTILNVDLLEQLAEGVLQRDCALLIEDGWAWAKTHRQLGDSGWRLDHMELAAWATEEEKAVFKSNDYAALRRIEQILLERCMNEPEAKKASGVLVSVSHDGEINRRYFLLEPGPDDEQDDGADGDERQPPPVEEEAPPPADGVTLSSRDHPKINFALRQSTSEILTMALAKELADNPDVALAAGIAALRCGLAGMWHASPFMIQTGGWDALANVGEPPISWVQAFNEALASPRDQIAEAGRLMAQCLDLRQFKIDTKRWSEYARQRMIDAMTKALDRESLRERMLDLFDPAAYFKRLTMAEIKTVLVEELGHSGSMPNTKSGLADVATALARDAKWLPANIDPLHNEPVVEPVPTE